ncbi:MAG: sugar ABC transporter permease, partial [Clostridiales bacterium]|nr:sugar ABC transporter permease [Clostridiales bacterium]
MGKSNLKKRYAKYGYLYSIPFILAFSIFFLYPTALTFILGFTDLKGAGNTEWHFLTTVGKPWYQNFEDVLKSKTFWKAFTNTWLFWISGFIPELFLAFLFSVWYSDRRLKIKGTLIFKIIYYMPHLVAGSVTA